MEHNKPTWLDERYLQKILQKIDNDDSIAVSSLSVKPAAGKGDHYASDMLRVTVVLTRLLKGHEVTETRSVIVKIAPEDGARLEMITNTGLFDTEISMMLETLPIMNAMLAKFSTTVLAARCLHIQYESPLHLIIEDLAPGGFQMANKRAGLDLDHCLLAIRNLASFHASSAALLEKDPTSRTKYKRGMFHKDHTNSLGAFFTAGTKAMAEQVVKWPELSTRISEKVVKIAENVYEKVCNSTTPREGDFNVITHGDVWVNNMLFRYDEQRKPIDQIFVDFQFSFYSSAAFDILYFFGTSLSENVQMNHRELLVREYHTFLTSTMANLKCKTKPPSFDDLLLTMKAHPLCEVIPAFTILPMMLAEEHQIKSLDEMASSDGKFEMPAYQGKLLRKVMLSILPFYDSLGMLDG